MTGFIIFICVVLFLGGFFLFLIKRKRKRLSPGAKDKLLADLQKARGIPDIHRRVLEADKVLEQALRQLGYSGGVGEMLKVAGPRLKNLDALWRAHKLRNTVAHEQNVSVSENEAEIAIRTFEATIKSL